MSKKLQKTKSNTPRSEKDIELEIRKHLERNLGAYVIKQHGSAFTKPGIPDLTLCLNGWFIGIEVKNEKGIVSSVQKVHIKNIKKAGGIAFVARSLEEVIDKLEEADII